jgi:hypothetical protein
MLKGQDNRAQKFLSGTENENRQRAFRKHERDAAKELGGVETVGSGAKGMKGDAWGGDRDAGQRIMAECKSTKNRSISLSLDWLEKLALEAFQRGMEGVLMLRFDSARTAGKDYAVVPKDRYLELLAREAELLHEDRP